MLHTKFYENRPAGSREEAYVQNLVKNGPVVSEKSMF